MEDTLAAEAYPDEVREFDIRHHFGVIRSRFWTIVACAVVLFTVAVLYTFQATPIYEASARLLIERRAPQVSPFEDMQERRDKEYFATQVSLITSRAVLDKALEDDRLTGLFQAEDMRQMARPGLWHSAFREVRAVLGYEPVRPVEAWELLREIVGVRPVKDTNLVDILVRAPDANVASLVANLVAQAYVDYSVAARQQSAGEAFEMLQRQMKEQEKALVKAEDDLLTYREQTTIPELGTPNEQSPVLTRRRALNDEFTRVQLKRIELGVVVQANLGTGEEPQDLEELLSISIVRSDPAVAELYGRLTQIDLDLQGALRSFGLKHPEVVALNDEREHVLSGLREAMARAVDSIHSEYAVLVAREQELVRVLLEETRVALEQARKVHVYSRLERDAERQARVFDVIVDRMREVDLTKDVGVTNVSFVERASPPQAPVRPNKQVNLILGALLGVLLGVGLAYGLEYLDDTVKTPDDVERRLNMPWLGYVPQMHSDGSREGLVSLAQHAIQHATDSSTEAFRSIRTNIYFSGQRGEMKTLMVTSAAPQDGKTVFAANLATTMAQDGKRVLLVDADLRRPALHRAFELERSPGLTNLLVEGRALQEIVQQPSDGQLEGLQNLYVLSAGAKTPNPAELLGSSAMARLVRQSREQYDVVIFDSCPAMFVADAAPIASGCDGVVIVLKASKSRCKAADRARRQLAAVNGRIIGAVLNDVRPKTLRRYGSYGYYYYDYHRYYKDYQEDEGDELEMPASVPVAVEDERPDDGPDEEGSAERFEPGTVSFVVRGGQDFSFSFELEDGQQTVVGRSSAECDIGLPSASVSPQHCRIANSGGRIVVEDLGSANGTFVGYRRVRRATVGPGDVIRISPYTISVEGPTGNRAG
ncbi:MAG: hypothetical protein AMK73_03465 [Planctomycetes bacterium SM23_32]|nr:MAG: hypothetical protein AMK73_03465 [Planctomycetes bacterium SM23_32]